MAVDHVLVILFVSVGFHLDLAVCRSRSSLACILCFQWEVVVWGAWWLLPMTRSHQRIHIRCAALEMRIHLDLFVPCCFVLGVVFSFWGVVVMFPQPNTWPRDLGNFVMSLSDHSLCVRFQISCCLDVLHSKRMCSRDSVCPLQSMQFVWCL